MKKLVLLTIGILSIFTVSFGESFAAVCDQSFNGGMLRYNKAYGFTDTWHNTGNATDYINSLDVDYIENGNFNQGSSASWNYLDAGSPFDLSDTLRDNNFAVPGNSSMLIVDTKPTNWRIQDKPSTRSNGTISNHDFGLRYTINYDNSNNYPNTNDDIEHTECIYYSVSSCGDGVRDAGFEICDPNDTSKAGWGNGGCSNSCEPIIVDPIATCDDISATPTGGQAPFITSIVCEGTNVDSYKIQCGNGQVLNSRTGQCSYDVGGSYQAQCIVNGNITSNSCMQTIRVTNPNPGIRIDKTDGNSDDIDGNQGNDTQTVALSTKAVFKIRVTNSGNEDLKTLRVIDAIAPNCAGSVTLPNTKPSTWSNFKVAGSGNHSNNVLEPGEYYEYTCEKGNTQSAYDNVATTRGVGVDSGETVSDVDDTEVLIVTPNIQIIKIDSNSNDRDGIPGNDTQTVNVSDGAIFTIIVKNNGSEDLKDIILTDALAGACDSNGDTVNLSGKSFINKLGTTVSIDVSGSGNHNDNIFQINEQFSYSCEEPNTTSNYKNIVSVTGVGVLSGETVNDDDHSDVIVEITPDLYDLALRKTVVTSGPYIPGQDIEFKIEVFNKGNIDSGEIEVTDYIPTGLTLTGNSWDQVGDTAINTISNIGAGMSSVLEITFNIDSDFEGEIKNYAEISNDSGDDCDSTPDNENRTDAGEREEDDLVNDRVDNGCQTDGDEDDHDIEVITVEQPLPNVDLIKSLAQGQDTIVNIGDTVNYVITVRNTGTADAVDQQVQDQFREASNGGLALVPSALWIEESGVATYTNLLDIAVDEEISLDISFTITDSAEGIVRNLAVVCDDSTEDCDPVVPPTCDDIDEEGNPEGCTEVELERYDLALRKEVSSVTPGPFNIGEDVTFIITVFNQGTFESGEIEITDYIPTGLSLNDGAWAQSGNSATRTIANIAIGDSAEVSITFTIDADAPMDINNFAEISSDNGDDCDSTPDSTNGNVAGENTELIDDAIGSDCEEGGDEDDHDIAPIVVQDGQPVVPSCDAISASPNSAQGNSLTTTLTCTGTAADIFRIEVTDEAGNVVNTINDATGTITLDRGTLDTANFTARCYINNTVTSNSCEQSLQISNGGGGGGGGSPAACLDIIRTSTDTFQCVGNDESNSISLRCGTDVDGNTVFLPTQEGILGTDGRRTANFSCVDDATPTCLVRKVPNAPTPISENNWIVSNACQFDEAPVCGDGVVDPATEVCDAGTGIDGINNNGRAGFACNASCQLPSSSSSGGGGSSSSGGGGGGGSSSSGGGGTPTVVCNPTTNVCSISTTPGGSDIVFGPFGGTIVGHDVNVFEDVPQYPYIENKSANDYSFAELCVVKSDTSDNSVTRPGSQEICADMRNKMLYGYEKLYIAQKTGNTHYEVVSQYELASGNYEYPDYISNKDNIPAGNDFGEVTLITTIKDDIDRDGTIDSLQNSYLRADLDVRVAKPSIATVGGGVSYIKEGDEITGDIRKVTDGVVGFSDNTNFVGVSVTDNGANSISSSVEENSDTDVVGTTQSVNDSLEKNVNDVTVITTTSGPDKNFGDFENFNGLDNIYIIKGSNVILGALPVDPSAPTTYIVEGGNLTFTENITTDQNIAFVVKGGDIIIESDVTELSGTYISIETTQGGDIKSESSKEQLIVYGSLLGRLDELISNRYYIEKSGSQLSVGTIVSFGSRLLSKPAPLVAQFKSEYNASQKVAQ